MEHASSDRSELHSVGSNSTDAAQLQLAEDSVRDFLLESYHVCCGLGNTEWLDMNDDASVKWWSKNFPSLLLHVGFGVFLDQQRKAAIATMIPKLRLLFRGQLLGQRSCFLFVGPHGVGKSTFLQAVAAALAKHAPATSLIEYVNWKSRSLRRPSELIFDALKQRHPRAYEEAVNNGKTIGAVHKVLAQHKISFVLVIDELEMLFTKNDEQHTGILHELHAIGEYKGLQLHPRRIIVIATGSAAVLYRLAYNLAGYPELRASYPLHGLLSLNTGKYVACAMRPLCTRAEAADAIAALVATNKAFEQRAVDAGLLDPSDTGNVNEATLDRLLMLSRGMVRNLIDLPLGPMARNDVLPRLHSAPFTGGDEDLFLHLFTLWKESFADGTDLGVAATQPNMVAKFAVTRNRLGDRYMLAGPALYRALYKAADRQVICYDSETDMVCFLHPSDPASYLLSECGPEAAVEGDKDVS